MCAPDRIDRPTTSTSSCTAAVAIISGVWCRPVYTTSMPASRSAAATTLAPRSWPSRPGLATSTRIGRGSEGREPAMVSVRPPGKKVIHQGAERDRRGRHGGRARRQSRASKQDGLDPRRSGAEHIHLVEVAHVQRLLRGDAERVQRGPEDTRDPASPHLPAPSRSPRRSSRGGRPPEGLLDPAVAVGHHAEPETGRTEPGQRLRRCRPRCEHQRCRSWCMRPRQSRTSSRRSAGTPPSSEQRLEVGGGPVAIGAARPLHGPGRRGAAPAASASPVEREPERRADLLGHARVVEKDEGVARVEQDRADAGDCSTEAEQARPARRSRRAPRARRPR